jgi:hypothetical protein
MSMIVCRARTQQLERFESRKNSRNLPDVVGFHLCKWSSNRKELFEEIPEKDTGNPPSTGTEFNG